MTWLILLVVLVAGVGAYRAYQHSPNPTNHRKAHAWAWAFWGGLLGSFFGVAGFGMAVAGTGVGALIGYLLAGAVLGKRADLRLGGEAYFEQPETSSNPAPTPVLAPSYFARVNVLRARLKRGELELNPGHITEANDSSLTFLSTADVNCLESAQTWWIEALEKDEATIFVHVVNTTSRAVKRLGFSLGPTRAGGTIADVKSFVIELRASVAPRTETLVTVLVPYAAAESLLGACTGNIDAAWGY